MYYVYLHKKPDGTVFYVGKGKGSRCNSIHNRNPMWKAIVKKYGFTVEIFQSGLQEWYAFELEEALTYHYGLRSDGGTLVNMCYGGGGNNGYVYTEDVKALISKKNSGIGNGRADKNVYTFVRISDNFKYIGTRQEFTNVYNISVCDIFKGKVYTTLGWTIEGHLDKLTKVKFDPTLYTFVHQDGRTITANRREFKKQTDVDPKGLFKSEPHRNKSVKGWSLQIS